jgi:hypothetical protein
MLMPSPSEVALGQVAARTRDLVYVVDHAGLE